MYLYDLRQFNAPTAVIEAHDGPVHSVLFRPGGNRENVSSLLATLSKTSSLSSVNLSKVKENVEPSRNSSFGSQVFSPIRDGFCNANSNLSGAPMSNRMSMESIFSPLRDTSSANAVLGSMQHGFHSSNDSLFSPLRDHFGNASTNISPLVSASTSAKKFSVTPLLSSISEEASKTKTEHESESEQKTTSVIGQVCH